MDAQKQKTMLADSDDLLLITGAAGFIGSALITNLLARGYRNLRCFVRPSSNASRLDALARQHPEANLEVVTGNLLSREDCELTARDAAVVFHLAAGTGQKSFPDAFMNSVVTTRNLLEALRHEPLRRFVSLSSFAVYGGLQRPSSRVLDESSAIEDRPDLRDEAYCFAKIKQDEIVAEYGKKFSMPYAIVRPGYIYGPGKSALTNRVGIDTFGIFLHLGGSNPIPCSYIDNCAEAIALAGLTPGIDGQVFNVVDDDLPSSRRFLRLYKANVKRFTSLYVPPFAGYALSYFWELYANWSKGQLPPAFNRRKWNAYWRKTQYSNERLKRQTGWRQKVPTGEALSRYFAACVSGGSIA